MMGNFVKKFLVFIFFGFIISTHLSAIELENKIPPSIWEFEMNFYFTPTYSTAYNGYGEKVPLHEFILWDREWRESVNGELKREEQKIEIRMTYAFIENWLIKANIPLLQKKQTSTLNFESGTSTQKEVVRNLDSESLNGLGDISLQIANDLSYGTTWHNRGGLSVRIPTGNTGIPRGTVSNAIGERHGSLGAFLHLTWFPLVHGLRNSFRIHATNELLGNERETLDGVRSYYSAGNRVDIHYNWSVERQNIFAGTELHYFQQEESSLPSGKSNNAYLKEISFEFGYGNLSDLEQKPLLIPWQVRLGYTLPIAGQNTLFANRWQLTSAFFF